MNCITNRNKIKTIAVKLHYYTTCVDISSMFLAIAVQIPF